jgi:2-polyprenyl-6-methoxyphenol hydroxylase-like FAD-dependent oxidoreductase
MMTEHAVVIAGGGPTGLMLAGELALASVDVAIVERRTSQNLVGSRAGGLHPRTIEVLDQRGIADRFLAEGQKAKATGFAGVHFDLVTENGPLRVSTPNTFVRGTFPRSGRSLLPPLSWFGQTDMWPGWET